MIVFIGGAARCGKSILSRRLLAEGGLPYLSLDVLKMGLTRGMPELALDPNAGAQQVAGRLWGLVREMSESLLWDGIDYVFEGELLPKDVAALRAAHPGRVCACFLGYGHISPERKRDEIRSHAGTPNDWTLEMDDSALLTILRREIAFSRYLESECARWNFAYYDLSEQFLPVLARVFADLRGLQAG